MTHRITKPYLKNQYQTTLRVKQAQNAKLLTILLQTPSLKTIASRETNASDPRSQSGENPNRKMKDLEEGNETPKTGRLMTIGPTSVEVSDHGCKRGRRTESTFFKPPEPQRWPQKSRSFAVVWIAGNLLDGTTECFQCFDLKFRKRLLFCEGQYRFPHRADGIVSHPASNGFHFDLDDTSHFFDQ